MNGLAGQPRRDFYHRGHRVHRGEVDRQSAGQAAGYATPGVRKRLKIKEMVKTTETRVRKRIEGKDLGKFCRGREGSWMPEDAPKAAR